MIIIIMTKRAVSTGKLQMTRIIRSANLPDVYTELSLQSGSKNQCSSAVITTSIQYNGNVSYLHIAITRSETGSSTATRAARKLQITMSIDG